jgi:hypothetical protein
VGKRTGDGRMGGACVKGDGEKGKKFQLETGLL